MNTRDILARVNEIAELAYKGDAPLPVGRALCELREALEDQVRTETAASGGTLNALKAVKAMLAANKKSGSLALGYAWTDGEGRQCVCDGFRAYRLREALPLEPRPDNAGDGIDLDKVYPDTASGLYAAAPLPSVSDLRAYIAVQRAKQGPCKRGQRPEIIYRVSSDGPAVNAEYLLDLIAVFPDATHIMYNATCTGALSPLVVRTERGDAVLLPMRVFNDAEELKQARRDRLNAAGQRVKDYPLPEGATPTDYACRTLRESSSKAIEPDVFAACLDMIAVA